MEGVHIVSVDDDCVYNELRVAVLRAASFCVDAFESPTAAIPHNLVSKPDFLVLDNRMPEMLGTEMARELRQRGFVGRIIMITADPEDVTDHSYLDLVLDKGLGPRDLFNALTGQMAIGGYPAETFDKV